MTNYYHSETCLKIQYPDYCIVQNTTTLPFFQLNFFERNEKSLLADLYFMTIETQITELDTMIKSVGTILGKSFIFSDKEIFNSTLGDGIKATLLTEDSNEKTIAYFFLTKSHFVYIEGSSKGNISSYEQEFDKIVESAVLNCE